jgi:hypothetical protein
MGEKMKQSTHLYLQIFLEEREKYLYLVLSSLVDNGDMKS